MTFREVAVWLVKQHGLMDLCEVGVYTGDLSRMLYPLARTLVLVDPFSALWNRFNLKDGEYTCTMGAPPLTQYQLNRVLRQLHRELPGALILPAPSHLAVQHVPDHSLDFVFIDAIHTKYHVNQDLYGWWPKLRPGGILAGDDYIGEVKESVDRFFGNPGLLRSDCKLTITDNVWWCKR